MKKIAINGLGRIGKLFLQSAIERNAKFDIIINTPADLDTIVYELKHDSVHPPIKEPIKAEKDTLVIGKRKINVYHELAPENLPWKEEKIDLVVECTGLFTSKAEASKHLQAGAKRVLISAPSKDPDITIVPGVNTNKLTSKQKIISCGSCTTNCVAPILKVLNEKLKITSAVFVTTHAYTSTQKIIDSSDKKDERRGRAATENIIPTTSGASESVTASLPELKGKLIGYALRVPVIDGSFSSIIAQVEKPTTKEKLNKLFQESSKKEMKNIIQYSTDLLVSTDILHNPSSAIFDSTITETTGNQISLGAWYDNEWGYSNRLLDLAMLILERK